MDGFQAVARARALYRVLPKAGFSQATFEELGTAARFGRTFESLSAELKATLFVLVRDYTESLNMIEVEEGIAAAAVTEGSEPSGTTSIDTSNQDDEEDEATPETVGTADTEPSPSPESPDNPASGITPSIPAPEDYPAKPGIEHITP